MDKAALAAGDLGPPGYFGTSPDLKPEAFDPDGARRLLAEAGWPEGFGLTIHGPNDRYVNDERVAQSLAGMLTRAGIQTTVVTMPSAVYFSRANRLEFSMMLVGWGADTGEASSPLKALLATYDRDKGMGTTNRGRYSNPKMDAALQQALATVDDARREKLLQEATEIAIGDLGIIPLYHQVNVWATRRDIGYAPRTDERTYAFELKPR
jgi:peptide/nickel transport system substrate-binding protein